MRQEKHLDEGAKSKAMRQLTAIFDSKEDFKNADVWKKFFLSEDFLREQYSEGFVNDMIQYLSYWQKQEDREDNSKNRAVITKILGCLINTIKHFFQQFRRNRVIHNTAPDEVSLPAGFLTELAIAYALRLDQGQSAADVSNTFPTREIVAKRWDIEMNKMGNSPARILNTPECVVRMRAFQDYLQLRHMNAENKISPGNKGMWSKILLNGQARCLYEQNTNEGYLYEEYRGECLIVLFTFWIQNETVPKCVLECMYQEYNLKNVEHSMNRKLYAPLKQEILRQYPDIESTLYGEGARAQRIADCFRELSRIVSDNHSNYDKGLYEESLEIKNRIQTLFASSMWQELQYDLELFDKIYSQFHFRHVMPVSLSERLIAHYSQEEQWRAEDRARQLMLEGLIPSLGFNRRIREIEGLPIALNKTGVEDIGDNNLDFWQYYLTWGFGLRDASEEDGIRPHKYNRDNREYLPAYMEYTYYPSLTWQKCFTGFDERTKEISNPVSMEWSLPDQRTLKAAFHLHYVLYWIDGQLVHNMEYTFDDFVRLSASLEKAELFFFLLAITSIEQNECGKAISMVEKWLQKTPLYPQTIPDIARLLVDCCRRRNEESKRTREVYYMEQEQLCIRAVVRKEKVVFYALRDFAWQKFHEMTIVDSAWGEQTKQSVTAFLQGLKQPLPVSLGTVSLDGMESKEKAKQIMEALKRHETNSSLLTETYCVLRYGAERTGERVLYCAMNPFGADLTQRNAEIAKQYGFSCQELNKKVKEKHRIAGFLGWGDSYTPKEVCDPKPFAIGESGTYYYYQSFRMRRGDSLAALLPEMFDLANVTEVECFSGYLSISQIDGHLEYCYGERGQCESVHSLEKTGADFLSVFTETGILMKLVSWLDNLLLAHETEVQRIQLDFRQQTNGFCLVEVVSRPQYYGAHALDEERIFGDEVFVWKRNCRGAANFKRLKDMLAWYLEKGTYGSQLKSMRRIDIAYWIDKEQVMEETVLIKTEFGIIDCFDETKDYGVYEPEQYHCVYIDDDRYIDDWWERLRLMKTYFHRFSRPEMGLARYGVTLIPPESLHAFQDIVLADHRINEDEQLVLLAQLIQKAVQEGKYMIHFGV